MNMYKVSTMNNYGYERFIKYVVAGSLSEARATAGEGEWFIHKV